MKRLLRGALLLTVLMTVAVAGTVLTVERSCTGAPATRPPEAPAFGIDDAGYRRAEGDSFMTYPEWNIVHAYTDLAEVSRQSSESGFDYLQAVRGFWSSLCGATSVAASAGGATFDQKVTNYIIGFSFTGEMAVQGLYERTLGALTAWWRGDAKTAEDEFAQSVLDEYAAFLQQTPWFRFPFREKLSALWSQTPFVPSLRSIERRGSLSLQYAAKSVYAALIGYMAGYSPATLTIRSVVSGLDETDLSAEPRITKVREVDSADGRHGTLIETPRYKALTDIIRGFSARQRTMLEIAGNRRILTTVIATEGKPLEIPGAVALFSLPIQSRPSSRRIGYDTSVQALAAQIGLVEAAGGRFEHAYDY